MKGTMQTDAENLPFPRGCGRDWEGMNGTHLVRRQRSRPPTTGPCPGHFQRHLYKPVNCPTAETPTSKQVKNEELEVKISKGRIKNFRWGKIVDAAEGGQLRACSSRGPGLAEKLKLTGRAARTSLGKSLTLEARGRQSCDHEKDQKGDVQGDQWTQNGEVYWSTYAIKEWLKRWFEQHPREAWTIDNYDGEDSYKELDLKLNRRHMKEPPLAPRVFHQMRAKMKVIEVEMDEIVDPDNKMPVEKRKTEWNKLREVALSICDDYMPGQSQWGMSDDQLIAKGYGEPQGLRSGSNSAEDTNHESDDQDDLVVREDLVMGNPRTAETRQSVRQHAEYPIKDQPHTLRNGSCSAAEVRHVSGDQDDLVDCNDHARTPPRKTEMDQRMWRDQGQAYYADGWSANNNGKSKASGQLACFLKGQARRKQKLAKDEEDESEDEPEQMVCNMNGQEWERLPFSHYC